MEEKMNVSLKYFDDALVQRVIDFTELSDDKKTKENLNKRSFLDIWFQTSGRAYFSLDSFCFIHFYRCNTMQRVVLVIR